MRRDVTETTRHDGQEPNVCACSRRHRYFCPSWPLSSPPLFGRSQRVESAVAEALSRQPLCRGRDARSLDGYQAGCSLGEGRRVRPVGVGSSGPRAVGKSEGSKRMFASMRRYRLQPELLAEFMRRVDESFADAIAAQPGFVSYELIDCGGGDVFTLSIFLEPTQAEASRELAG